MMNNQWGEFTQAIAELCSDNGYQYIKSEYLVGCQGVFDIKVLYNDTKGYTHRFEVGAPFMPQTEYEIYHHILDKVKENFDEDQGKA
jgi:hypothetical protein